MRAWKIFGSILARLSNMIQLKEFWFGITCGYFVAIFCNKFSVNPPIFHNDRATQSVRVSNVSPDAAAFSGQGNDQLRPDRILCWVVTMPGNLFKAERVKHTWGKRCDKLIFVSSQNDTVLPAIGFPIGVESRPQLWNKAKFTLRYVYQHHLNDFDWFFKADDDTYAIMENMRYYLASMNSSLPLFLGRRFRDSSLNVNFLAGGPGYVLSRESLRRLVEKGLNGGACPDKLWGSLDDLIISSCLEKLGAIFADTRDRWGHQRFIPFDPEELYDSGGKNIKTSDKFDIFPVERGYNCCSNDAISFHYISGYKMQLFEYLIYKLNVLGADSSVPISENKFNKMNSQEENR